MKKVFQSFFHGFCRMLCVLGVWSLYRFKVYNKEKVPDKGPLLVLCNHQSFLDPIFCQLPVRRTFFYIARDTLWSVPFFGWVISNLYAIPIRRGEADLKAMKEVIEVLKRGRAVVIYPEGTRTPDGRIAQIKPGFSLLVRRSGAKVVTMVIEGAHEVWPKGQKRPKLGGKIVLSFGDVMDCDQVKQMGDQAFAQWVTQNMRHMQAKCRRFLGKEPFDYDPQPSRLSSNSMKTESSAAVDSSKQAKQ